MSKIEIWNRPVSHWHMKMWPTGNLVCQTFGPTDTRSIKAKIDPNTIESIFSACAELGKIEHDPETYKSDVIVVYVVHGSNEYNLILSDFEARPPVKKLIENILDRVIRQTQGMTGLVELEGSL